MSRINSDFLPSILNSIYQSDAHSLHRTAAANPVSLVLADSLRPPPCDTGPVELGEHASSIPLWREVPHAGMDGFSAARLSCGFHQRTALIK